MARKGSKGFKPPKRGKVEVAFETVKRPFAHLARKTRGAYGKVAKHLS